MSHFGYTMGLIWGLAIGGFMQFTPLGRWMGRHMTWVLVHFVMAGDMLILLAMTQDGELMWREAAMTMLLTTMGPSVQGVWKMYKYFLEMMSDADEDSGALQGQVGYAGRTSRDGWG